VKFIPNFSRRHVNTYANSAVFTVIKITSFICYLHD
jgi:hypothetical protein